jgi:hypothetical protein
MNDYCEVIARKCKIPDPSLGLIDSTRFTLSQARRVVLVALHWLTGTVPGTVLPLRYDSV